MVLILSCWTDGIGFADRPDDELEVVLMNIGHEVCQFGSVLQDGLGEALVLQVDLLPLKSKNGHNYHRENQVKVD